MKRKSLEEDAGPVARALEAVGDAWSVLIVRQAFAGDRRWGWPVGRPRSTGTRSN